MRAQVWIGVGLILVSAGCSGDGDADKKGDEGSGGAAGDSGATKDAGDGATPMGDAGDPKECLSRAATMGESQACAACSCSVCLGPATSIYAADAAFEAKARAVVDCARRSCCAGIACYCGVPVDLTACATTPAGPCVAEIEAAAGAAGLTGIIGPANDMASPLGAAAELGRCTIGDPNDLGGAIVGNCPECLMTCE